jgi:glycosyltransferase involved in cell wall biosynthesis
MSARILTSYYRPKPGGFCKRYFRAIRALLEANHEVHYLAVVPFPIDHPKCHFHRFPWPRERTDTLVFWALFHLLAPWLLLYMGIRYRISHAFVFGPTYSAIMQPLRLIKRLPVTLFLRGDTIRAHQIKGRSRWVVSLDRWFEGLAIWGVRVYAVSENLARTVMARHRWLRPSCCGTLRNDIPVWNIRGDTVIHVPLRLACVGILEPTKNQQLVLQALQYLPKRAARLHLYGTGPDEAVLRAMALAADLVADVRFMGWVESEHIWPEVDLLLMPSVTEGAPNAIIEALGQGVPVLASDIPEHREILPVSNLVRLGDPCAWVRRINEVLEHPRESLSAMAANQMAAAQALRFDWAAEFRRRVMAETPSTHGVAGAGRD